MSDTSVTYLVAVTITERAGEQDGDIEHEARAQVIAIDEAEALRLIEEHGAVRTSVRSKTITESERTEIRNAPGGGPGADRYWTARVEWRLLQEAIRDVVSGSVSRRGAPVGS